MAKFAIVTGASSGIGLELAKLAAKDGFDLLVAADTPLVDASGALEGLGANVRSVEADLSTEAGVRALLDAAGGRNVDVLVANAGHGVLGIGCVRDVVFRFIDASEDRDALAVDAACAAAVPRPPAFRPITAEGDVGAKLAR